MIVRLVSIVALFMLAACSSDPEPQPGADSGISQDDMSGDVDVVDPDVGTDAGADAGPRACDVQDDCPVGDICVDGSCVASVACNDLNDWRVCTRELTPLGDEVGLRASCGPDGYCILGCMEDSECRAGETCTDYGYCRTFSGDLDAPRVGGEPRTTLRAGASNVLMNFPIGISLAGYGSRVDRSDHRYAGTLSESRGTFHGLYGRALALDNGERRLLVVRLPVVFASSWLHEAVARRLQDITGRDWRDSLVISATHTHSGPARFWPLVADAALDVGRLGADSYHHMVFEWLVETTVETATAALDDLQPAQLGWKIVEAYDTDDAIASDRWEETPPFDDNRLLMMRVNDASGEPLGALISLGIHATFNEEDYLTGDAAGALEHALELDFGGRYGKFVPVMFMSENGGSMSPRGGGHGHSSLHKHEYIGYEFAARVAGEFDTIETSDDIDLEAETHYFPISYERVGYEVGEWSFGNTDTPQNTFYHGAIQCTPTADEDYETHADPYRYGCLPLHLLSQNRPISVFRRSLMTALRIDGLTVITLPGEASMEIGWQVLRDARDELGVDPAEAFVWGYAQDHQLYLTPTNLRGELPTFPGISTPMAPDDYPDFAFSWLQGGYEAGLSAWGHKFGDFIVARALETLGLLDDPSADLETALPAEYTPFTVDAFEVEPTPADVVGTVVTEVPAQVERLTPIEFAWVGGDPGIEMPQVPEVVLERQAQDGAFETFTRQNFRVYSNREPVMITRVRRNADRWEWIVYWEEIHDFPRGAYRFRVNGHHDVNGTRTPYEVTSEPFELIGVSLLASTTINGSSATGTLSYPAGAPLEVVELDEDPGSLEGTFRMRHPDVPSSQPAPVDAADVTAFEVRVVEAGGAVWATYDATDVGLSTSGAVPRTSFTVDLTGAPAGVQIEVSAEDQFGNATP